MKSGAVVESCLRTECGGRISIGRGVRPYALLTSQSLLWAHSVHPYITNPVWRMLQCGRRRQEESRTQNSE